MYANAYNYNSRESLKKNIKEYDKKALDIIKQGKIYGYNFKTDKDNEKQYLGFIIGDEGGKYETPIEVIANDNSGINVYNMASVLWKAIQELQQEIEELKNK